MNIYPLKFEPILMHRIWGGTKLASVLGKKGKDGIVGESWELSGVKNNVSVVSNGVYKGSSLSDLIDRFPRQLLGESVLSNFGKEFPILIKFIDATKDLSIQLHPNDTLAKKRHNSLGKTEMWYIMDADKGSNLIIGFKEDVTEERYKASLEKDGLMDLLHFETVDKGDSYFINAGKIHAIGKGILLAEIQQTSDVTYRVYDYNRRDADGNLRELHTELALKALDYKKKNDFKLNYDKTINKENLMVKSPYFTTNFLPLDTNYHINLESRDCFTIYMCVNGEGIIANEYGKAAIKKGETVLLSANSNKAEIWTKGLELLEITV